MKTSALTAFPFQKASLVQEIVVSSPTSLITFSGLDGNADKGYYLEYEIINALSVSQGMRLYVNGDFTDANYKSGDVYNYNTSGTVASDGVIASPMINTLPAAVGGVTFGECVITSFDGFFRFVGPWQSSDVSGNMVTGVSSTRKSAAITNILQLDIKDITGVGIGIGSRFRLMRRETSPNRPAAVTGPSYLVEKKVLTADATSVTFQGLNSLADGDYVLEGAIPANASSADVFGFVNGDVTGASYKYQYLQGYDGPNVNEVKSTGGMFVGTRDASTALLFSAKFIVTGGKVFTMGQFTRDRAVAGNLAIAITGSEYTTTVAAINSLTVTASTAGALTSGSVFRLYKSITSFNGSLASPTDITSISTDYLLQPGETVYKTYTAATSVPLYVSTVPGLYEMHILGDQSVTISNTNNTTLSPNNTTVTAGDIDLGIIYQSITSNADGSVAPLANTYGTTETMFSFGNGIAVKVAISISTYTKTKTMDVTTTCRTTATNCNHMRAVMNWLDTSTIWSSLGTLTFPFAQSGTIIIKRIL